MSVSFSRLDLRSGNFRGMMAACGVEMRDLDHDSLGLTLGAAARACRFCQHDEDCRRWLDSSDPALVNDPPSFCPNRERFLNARNLWP